MPRAPFRPLLLTVAAAFVVAATYRSFPLADQPPFDSSLFGSIDPAKLAGVVLALAGLALLNLAGFGLGRPLRRRLAPDADESLQDVVTLGFGFVVLGNLIFGLACLRLLHPAVLAVAILLPAALGVRDVSRKLSLYRRTARIPIRPAAALAALFLSPMLGAFVPDYGWDAFVYHLGVPERYLFTGGVWTSEFSIKSAFPHLVQMLYLPTLAFDVPAVAKLLHLEFGILTVATLAGLASRSSRSEVPDRRRVGVWAAVFAVSILAADTLFFWETGIAYVDLPGAFYALLAVVSLHRADLKRPCSFLSAGVFAGAAFAIQYRLYFVLAGLLVALWWPSAIPSRPNLWLSRRLRASFVLGGTVFLVMLPWFVRNQIAFGNPVAPAAQSVFHEPGDEAFDPITIAQALDLSHQRGPGRDLGEFLAFPWTLSTGLKPSGQPYFSHQVGSLYFVALVACLLALGRAGPLETTCLRVALAMSVLWFWSGSQSSRYILPALVLLALPGGLALERLTRYRRVLRGVVVAVLAAGVLHGQWTQWKHLPWRWGYALGHLSVGSFEAQEPALVAGRQLRSTLGDDSRLLLVYESRGFLFRGLDYVPYHINEGAPTLQLIRRSADVDDLELRLRALGVTHVLVNLENVAKYRTRLVPGYRQADFDRDQQLLIDFLDQETELVLRERHVIVRRVVP